MYTTRLLTVSPSMHYAGGGVCSGGGGVCTGGCLVPGVPGWGCLLLGGVCLRVPGPGGVPGPRGVPGPGGCLLPGSGYLLLGGALSQGVCSGGICYRQTPHPPVNRFLTYAMLLKILPCPKLRLRAVNMVTFTIARRFRHFLWDNVNRYWEPLACPWTLGYRRKCVYTERK